MRTIRQVPGLAAVAQWLRKLKIQVQGCIKAVPDPPDPPAVAAYNEARRQLATEAKTEAHAEPEPAP